MKMRERERHARTRRWTSPMLATLLVAASLQGCLGSGSDESKPISDPAPPSGVISELTGLGKDPHKALVERCGWSSGRDVPEAHVRLAFVDRDPGDVRLLLAQPTVRPGEILSVAVANDSTAKVQYGTFSHIETEAGEAVRIKGPFGFPAIGLSAEPRAVGPCVTLPVPSSTPSGNYVAVLDDVRVADGEPPDLRASFEVAGKAITNPEWEVRLRQAARENQSRRQDRGEEERLKERVKESLNETQKRLRREARRQEHEEPASGGGS